MSELLSNLPTELQAALDRAWPGCPEAQRRAALGPWVEGDGLAVWPDRLWPWQPRRRWWRPGTARDLRESFALYFRSRRGHILDAKGPRLFDPTQPFFETPWTTARLLLRSPAPEVFTDAEYWAIAMQLFDGRLDLAERETRAWAQQMAVQSAVERGPRRSHWWSEHLRYMEMSAKGDFL